MSMMRQTQIQNDPIVPGPCPVNPQTGVQECPPPREIVCINVDKVYDFCVQSDFRFECFDVPPDCNPPLSAGSTVQCSIGNASCTEVPPRTPATGFPAGFFNVTVQINVPVNITVRNPDGTVRCIFTRTVRFIKPILLFAPVGTRIDCRILAAACREPRIVDGQICVKIELCVEIQALALVKLLVPAYGFCTPAECVPAAQPEFPCPPSDLFPEQPRKLHIHLTWQPHGRDIDPKAAVVNNLPKGQSPDADVDLYMKLPDGQVVNFLNPVVTYPGGETRLLRDVTVNPGPEDIVAINPPNGTYCICAHLFSLGGDTPPIDVTATYTYLDGQGRIHQLGPFTGSISTPCNFHNFPSILLPQIATGIPCSCT